MRMGSVMRKITDFLKRIIAMIVNPRYILDLFKIRNFDRNYNKVLANDRSVRLIAFVIAIVVLVSTRYVSPDTTRHISEFEAALEVRINEDEYRSLGSVIPETVTVFLSGDRTQVELLRNSGNLEFFVDLQGLEPGMEHSVLIDFDREIAGQIEVRTEPAVITGVEIAALIEREINVEEIQVAMVEMPELDARYVWEYTVITESVRVRGPEIFLDDIAEIRAILNGDLIDPELETQTYSVRLFATDLAASPIDIEFYPSELEIQVEIREDVRRVNIEYRLINEPYNVTTQRVIMEPGEIEVWGLFELLEDFFPIVIDFNELNNAGRKIIALELPDCVYSDTTRIEVQVDYSEIGFQENN